MSDAIVKHIPYSVDLNEPVKKTYIDTLLATEDNLAHCFDISLVRGAEAVALPDGTAVTAYFIRYSDNATVPIKDGSISGNVASITLTKGCYNKPGQFALIIKVSGDGGIKNTVFYGEGTVFASSTDKIVDEENVIPSLADLLAQIEAMEAGTAAANTATKRANAAAERCEQMQIDASGMAGDSNKLNGKDASEYVLHSAALTLEEIKASTDLTGKIPDADAVKTIAVNLGDTKSSALYYLQQTGVTTPETYGGVMRLKGKNWGTTFVDDSYFFAITATGKPYVGMQINGATDITWTRITTG